MSSLIFRYVPVGSCSSADHRGDRCSCGTASQSSAAPWYASLRGVFRQSPFRITVTSHATHEHCRLTELYYRWPPERTHFGHTTRAETTIGVEWRRENCEGRTRFMFANFYVARAVSRTSKPSTIDPVNNTGDRGTPVCNGDA